MKTVQTACLSLVVALGLTAMLLLGGCTTIAMEGMNGPGACDPLLAHQAMYNANVLGNLRDDQTLTELLEIAPPDHVAGTTYYYRTGAPHCSYLATQADFTAVQTDASGRIINPTAVLQQSPAVISSNPFKSLFR